ncbi:hypothetical protein [Methyloceanibacter caenitepidi]|uniref:Uncharacterized protein n=1 Tax=Methyloceanibacter caenitepidi TaxID=1384459 RepID=A0A0A8K5V5_9HYPH|nr:hypothetical protein [Methyloceanibacter caenitepidi]BAQ18328.1 hypothetical protein GL4_2895 [Methyloceanibacter caenitepidi]
MAQRGGKRPGAGRKKGSVNKTTKAERAAIAASGLTPREYLLSVMRDENNSQAVRVDAAYKVAPYCHSKLASIEHTGKDGGPIEVAEVAWTIADPETADPEGVQPASEA